MENVSIQNKDVFKWILRMYPSKEKRMNFLTKVALTFGLRLDALSQILGLDSEKIRQDFGELNSSLFFLFNHGFVNQQQAICNFYAFFEQLIKAYKEKDRNKIIDLLKLLGDKKAVNFKKNHHPGDKITDEEIGVLLRYQLKYGISGKDMASIFNIDNARYSKMVHAYVEDKPDLKSAYEYVSDFFLNSHWKRTL